jgi:SUMO ligase MMS21 Smc5/6 complex component
MEQNDKLVIMAERMERGVHTIDLTLEPNMFDAFGSKCRLTYDEYCDTINKLLEEEEKEWHELRMKDMVNLTRDALIEATMLKFAREEYQIDTTKYSANDMNYMKRYAPGGQFIGEAVVITLVMVPEMNMTVR